MNNMINMELEDSGVATMINDDTIDIISVSVNFVKAIKEIIEKNYILSLYNIPTSLRINVFHNDRCEQIYSKGLDILKRNDNIENIILLSENVDYFFNLIDKYCVPNLKVKNLTIKHTGNLFNYPSIERIFPSLTSLDITITEYNEEQLFKIFQMSSLNKVAIEGYDEVSLISFLEKLASCESNLESLSIKSKSSAFLKVLPNFKFLKELKIFCYELESLPKELYDVPSLEVLDLYNTQITMDTFQLCKKVSSELMNIVKFTPPKF